ncbi:hypothetical protein OIU78_027848 [Salix suchowensis]|nr:hypothetical protein OIU78_027848 [Salix suchowensis]
MGYRSCCPKQEKGHWLMLHQRGEHPVLSWTPQISLCHEHLPGKQQHPPSHTKNFMSKLGSTAQKEQTILTRTFQHGHGFIMLQKPKNLEIMRKQIK